MGLPILTVAQMRGWEEASWAAGITAAAVIDRAGLQVAAQARALTAPGAEVLVLAGRGNNGADARAAAAHLAGDRAVRVVVVADPAADLPAVQAALAARPALVVDGLFGIGLNRPLDAAWLTVVAAVNAARRPVLAVDVPSGLNADTGEPAGAAVQAAVTLTLGAPKAGMLRAAAAPYVNRLEVAADIGLIAPPAVGEMEWVMPADFTEFPPARPAGAHKGDCGRLTILAGSLGFHGAAVLAARAAQRAQPGLVSLFTQETVYFPVAAQLAAVMVAPWRPQTVLPATGGVLVGPGLADPNLPDEWKLATRNLWRTSPGAVVVDASALDWLAVGPVAKNLVRVITPHPGEAARLLRMSAQQVQANRPGALRELSRLFGNCWVVLKGQQTLIGRSTGKIFVNSSGNPHLAQGGSGDVLAGFLAGLLAQPPLLAEVEKTLAFGVWRHGAAADHLQARRPGWVVEELAAELCGEAKG